MFSRVLQMFKIYIQMCKNQRLFKHACVIVLLRDEIETLNLLNLFRFPLLATRGFNHANEQ